MATKREPKDYGLYVGTLPHGAQNNLADVPGVRVGHCTVDTPRHKTGVTVVLPTQDNIFEQKCTAASLVLNGFGKTCGLVQVEELGTLETPIALTNTLNVGAVHDAMVAYMVQNNPTLRSVNPVVGECNDGGCNDIRTRAVGQAEVFAAIADARTDFAEGDVGAGKGMTCHGLKGGIGSASRVLHIADAAYTLGVLVLANHGCLADLQLCGEAVGGQIAAQMAEQRIAAQRISENMRQAENAAGAPVPANSAVALGAAPPAAAQERDEGSCIILMATDLPLSARQIKRVLHRAAVGLARVGSYLGHGSGDIAIGFSTANRMPQAEAPAFVQHTLLNESSMDLPFRAMAEATEEAVLHALLCADAVTGADGKRISALAEYRNRQIFNDKHENIAFRIKKKQKLLREARRKQFEGKI